MSTITSHSPLNVSETERGLVPKDEKTEKSSGLTSWKVTWRDQWLHVTRKVNRDPNTRRSSPISRKQQLLEMLLSNSIYTVSYPIATFWLLSHSISAINVTKYYEWFHNSARKFIITSTRCSTHYPGFSQPLAWRRQLTALYFTDELGCLQAVMEVDGESVTSPWWREDTDTGLPVVSTEQSELLPILFDLAVRSASASSRKFGWRRALLVNAIQRQNYRHKWQVLPFKVMMVTNARNWLEFRLFYGDFELVNLVILAIFLKSMPWFCPFCRDFYPRDAMLAGVCESNVSVLPSVRPSVIRRYCIKTNHDFFTVW